ncbi:MAG: SAM-dependent methyltransferase, partial [Myxococcota bacterium]
RVSSKRFSRSALINLIRSLEGGVRKLTWEPGGTEWADYDACGSYEDAALVEKKEKVAAFLELLAPEEVWDLGANTGMFSRIACERGARVVAFDVDPGAVERNYRQVKADGEPSLLPLCLDLVNPSPALGWANRERSSLAERGLPDAILALALVHHLVISNNVPLDRVSGFFAGLTDGLIIEFVPKSDERVRTLLATRPDIFPGYTREGFERAFAERWSIEEAAELEASDRVLYCLRRRP